MKNPERVVTLLGILGMILAVSIIDTGEDERLGLFVFLLIFAGGGFLVLQIHEKNKKIKLHEERDKHDELFKKNTQTVQVKPQVALTAFSGEAFLYQGEGSYGLAHGKGKATTETGSCTYEGEFKDGKFHGYGYRVSKQHEKTYRYHGQFKNGMYDGYGVRIVTWKDSSGECQEKIEGNWKSQKPHGQTRAEYLNGDVYIGEYKDGLRNGKGTYKYKNKDEYTGEYKDGKEHGQGTFMYSNGDKYIGEFKDRKKHGQGSYIFSNGKKDEGEYLNGEFLR